MNIDELFNMSEDERYEYLDKEVDVLIQNCPTEQGKARLEGLQWRIEMLRSTKFKDRPLDMCQALLKEALEYQTENLKNARQLQNYMVDLKSNIEKLAERSKDK